MAVYESRAVFFPYCIQRLADGRHIVLNRNYKPLGVRSGEWVSYEDHPSAAHMKITPAIAKALSWNGSDDIGRIYLYADGCVPTDGDQHMGAYLKRLSALMPIDVELGS